MRHSGTGCDKLIYQKGQCFFLIFLPKPNLALKILFPIDNLFLLLVYLCLKHLAKLAYNLINTLFVC